MYSRPFCAQALLQSCGKIKKAKTAQRRQSKTERKKERGEKQVNGKDKKMAAVEPSAPDSIIDEFFEVNEIGVFPEGGKG